MFALFALGDSKSNGPVGPNADSLLSSLQLLSLGQSQGPALQCTPRTAVSAQAKGAKELSGANLSGHALDLCSQLWYHPASSN